MKVFELMAALAYMPAGKEVVMHCYGEHCAGEVTVVDYDKDDNVAIAYDHYAFNEYDKKHYGQPVSGDEE